MLTFAPVRAVKSGSASLEWLRDLRTYKGENVDGNAIEHLASGFRG